jgi:uncharacterized protein (DUF697 family)
MGALYLRPNDRNLASLSSKRSEAQALVERYVARSALTALVTGPIPGSSAMLTGTEAVMVYHIARIYGFQPTVQEAGATVAGLVATYKSLAGEVMSIVPVVGALMMKPAIQAAASKAIGELAIQFFERKLKEESTTVKSGRVIPSDSGSAGN